MLLIIYHVTSAKNYISLTGVMNVHEKLNSRVAYDIFRYDWEGNGHFFIAHDEK